MTYQDALHRFECAREQADECTEQYLIARDTVSSLVLSAYAFLVADAHVMEREAARALESVVADEMSAVIREERVSSEQLLNRRA
jgi:hypothetical protein